jgi:para-aminobenzoate synthetase/4-amino-4-deoxychorismate lyase
MTSTVAARSELSLTDVFAALFPAASITGAPKIRTMEILRELEQEPRGIYTGALGYVRPNGSARFGVAIRTAVVDRQAATVTFGVGSGIVWDSGAENEYEECLLKGAVLGPPAPVFDLLETLRWDPAEGFFVLERHVARMRDSADYFDFTFVENDVRHALDEAVMGAKSPQRVRLLLSHDGRVRTEAQPLRVPPAILRVRVADGPMDLRDVFLFHKTTRRDAYNGAARPDCDDTILWNEDGQATEATRANIVVERDGSRVTPPVECGLLAGTFRAELLASGELQEGVVTLDELRRAKHFWLVNSVYGWRRAELVDDSLLNCRSRS